MWYCDDCGDEFEYPRVGVLDTGVVGDTCPDCGSDMIWNDEDE
jgi:hypothetical protein